MNSTGRITDLLRELELFDFEYKNEFDEDVGNYTFNVLHDKLSLRIDGYGLNKYSRMTERLNVLSKIRISTIVRTLYQYFKFSKMSVFFTSSYIFDASTIDTCFKEIIGFNRLKHLEIGENSGTKMSSLTLSIDESINRSNLKSLRIPHKIPVRFDDVYRLTTIKTLSITIMDEESLQTIYNSINLDHLVLNLYNLSMLEKKKHMYEDYVLNKNTFILEKKLDIKMLAIIGKTPRFIYLSGMLRNFGRIDELHIVNKNEVKFMNNYVTDKLYLHQIWDRVVYGIEEE